MKVVDAASCLGIHSEGRRFQWLSFLSRFVGDHMFPVILRPPCEADEVIECSSIATGVDAEVAILLIHLGIDYRQNTAML